MFKVEFFEKDDGTYPAAEFILSQDKKMRAKLVHLIKLLELKGNDLRDLLTIKLFAVGLL